MRAGDTICALASGAGRAGVAVVRVSGPAAGAALAALAGPLPPPRRASLRTLRAPGEAGAIDQALILWFPAPASFTGEDCAELHVHGGQAVIAATIEALLAAGARPAEAGEFTRRAFAHGKLDLTQAEGLADLVDAETEGQRLQALRQTQGALRDLYDGWRAQLLAAVALVEAEIDFPDEDLPEGLASRAAPQITALATAMAAHLQDAGRGERVREGYRIAIIGAPNVGKSSLLNALAGQEAAIVSDIPGTTRDVVEVRLVLGGFPVWLADTAGLRAAADAIEAEGVRRALARAEAADLRLLATPAGTAPPADVLAQARPGDLIIRTKADLDPDAAAEGPRVSTRTGEGVAALLGILAARVTAALGAAEAPVLSRARHRTQVAAAVQALEAAVRAPAAELTAEGLRRAADALGRLTGRIEVEEVLGAVFANFCIGK